MRISLQERIAKMKAEVAARKAKETTATPTEEKVEDTIKPEDIEKPMEQAEQAEQAIEQEENAQLIVTLKANISNLENKLAEKEAEIATLENKLEGYRTLSKEILALEGRIAALEGA